MAWQKGPLPPETHNWGAVALVDDAEPRTFYFADFKGDHVVVVGGPDDGLRVYAEQVAWFDNSITLPPTGAKSRTGAA